MAAKMSSVIAECVSAASSTSSGASTSMNSGNSGLFIDVGMLLIEGRVAEPGIPRGYKEGPHCPHVTNSPTHHICQDSSFLCERASKLRRHMSLLNENSAPMCIDVLLCPDCSCGQARATSTNICQIPSSADLLIEQWTVSIVNNKNIGIGTSSSSNNSCPSEVSDRVLLQALRSQLHFSQLSAWYSLGKVKHVCYRLSHPVGCSGFTRPPVQHNFPLAKISQSTSIKVCLKSLPRTDVMPAVSCPVHSGQSTLNATVTVFKSVFAELGQCLLDPPARIPAVRHGFTMWRDSKASSPTRRQKQSPPLRNTNECSTHGPGVLDDRMLSGCKHIGKHHCEDDLESCAGGAGEEKMPRHKSYHYNPLQNSGNSKEGTSSKYNSFDLNRPRVHDVLNVYRCETYSHADLSGDGAMNNSCDRRGCGTKSTHSNSAQKAEHFFSAIMPRVSKVNPLKRKWVTLAAATSSEGSSKKLVSSAATKATELAEYFNKLDISVEETLPSPPLPPPLPPPPKPNAPLAIPQRRTLISGTDSSSEETEGESPLTKKRSHYHIQPSSSSSVKSSASSAPVIKSASSSILLSSSPLHRNRVRHSRPLLGSFEENVLSGRLAPVHKVEGFAAQLGFAGLTCPQHLRLPVTVSFFSFEPYSSPFLAETTLGKKGYTIPSCSSIQLTLLNPQGSVIRLFLIPYDVSDMPNNSYTFIRQRLVSTEPSYKNNLMYLAHLRIRRSKTGRIYITSDIQIICSRKYDIEASFTDHQPKNLKSIIILPSPRYAVK